MRNRTLGRQVAANLLYQLDLREVQDLDPRELDRLLEELCESQEARAFARELVLGTWEHRRIIDERIEQVCHNWKLDRMAAVDRNVIRLAAYEILFRDDIPVLVSINEAIELAKNYSTRRSGPFVNGVLDSLRKRFAPHKACSPRNPISSG